MTIPHLAICFEIILSVMLVVFYCKFILQPILRWGIIRELQNYQKALHSICKQDNIPLNSFYVTYLETMIKGMIKRSSRMSLSGFLHFILRRGGPPKPSELMHKFEVTAPLNIRKIHVKVVSQGTFLMAVNSLGWVIGGFSIYIFSKAFQFAIRPWFQKKSATFVEEETKADEIDFCKFA